MQRRAFLCFVGLSVFTTGNSASTQGPRVYKIGGLNLRPIRPIISEMWGRRMQERGYFEGKNLLSDYRYGAPAELASLAEELVRLDPDVLACGGSAPLRALMAATKEIPVVAMDLETDPIASGFAASLARPGGNLTGFFLDSPEFGAKRLQLLKQALANAKTVAVFWDSALDTTPLEALKRVSSGLSVRLSLYPVDSVQSIELAYEAAVQARADAVLVMQSPRLDALLSDIVGAGVQRRLPVFALFADYAMEGGLLSYGPNVDQLTIQAADYVDRIFRGAKAGDLPIQRPARFELVLNMRSAKKLGITVPADLLARADVVIN